MKRIIIFKLILLTSLFSQRVVGYYPKWMHDEFPVSDIHLSIVTHVIHTFAWPDDEGNVLSYSNMFNATINETIHTGGGKILLALGGWGNDVGFSTVAASPGLRNTFINNLIVVCDTYGYDGIDMDWEYPQSPEDRQNLNFLMAEMDSSFNAHNPEWLITMAVPVSNWYGQWYDFSFLQFFVDFFNAMTYDIHGSWTDHAGHNSPLYRSPPDDPDGSCHTGINYLVNSRGIPESQINLGLAFWGKLYDASTINGAFTGTVIDKRYYEIPSLINNGWTYHWDSDAYCPFLAKDDQTKILTFDDPESIRHKCEYALERELGGVMIWALGYDVTENGQELIQSIHDNYLENDNINADIIPTHLSLHAYPNPFNPVTNIDIELAREEHVQLNVFSVNGHHLETLVDDRLQKGRYSFVWNGRKEKNGNMSSSLYFIKLAGENSQIVKKVIYLK